MPRPPFSTTASSRLFSAQTGSKVLGEGWLLDPAGRAHVRRLGLDLAVTAVLDARLVWYAKTDRHAITVLAYRLPDIRNLGDIRSRGACAA